MGLISRLSKAATKFIVTETSGSALAKIGEHIGDAVGNLLAKKIDPNHGNPPTSESEESKEKEEEKT